MSCVARARTSGIRRRTPQKKWLGPQSTDDRSALAQRRLIATGSAVALFVLAGITANPLRAQVVHTIQPQVAVAIAARPLTPFAGAADADVTIIEFLDYNCPFCKKSAPELQKLLQADRRVRILYKEWPIFGDVSEYAARSALAANWQAKFLAVHNALISAPEDLDEKSQVDSLLKGIGVDLKRLADDRTRHATEIDAALARNAAEAKALGLRGTPGFLVGRQLLPTALTLQQLVQLTAEARTSQQVDGKAGANP
jgi:protein-disulfide isomerase